VALEIELGLLPKASSASVAERLKGVRSLSDATADIVVIKTGNVGIGIAAPLSNFVINANSIAILPAALAGVVLHAASPDTSVLRVLFDAAGSSSQICFRRCNNTMASPQVLSINQQIGSIAAFGFGATVYTSTSRSSISFNTSENWSDTAQGSNIIFSTTLNTTVTPAEKMRLQNDGKLGIGTNAATALLDVNSDIIRLRTAKTPANATDTGNAGDICWDSGFLYVCVATNSWKKVAIAAW
jgi:hypothetical protein